ncbi:MAG: chemotaxis protein CheX [Planctomycetes bacterium]|nr:chemotaxis protein CheX [Planctomycetota bacterium]
MATVTADSFLGLATMALERMAFVITTPSEDTPGEVLVDCVAHAVIEATGDHSYTLCVSASPGMVKEIASGMMGVDPDEIDVDDHARATVGELANILGGELVMLVTAGDSQMSLSLPTETSDEAAGALLDRSAQHGFQCVLAGDTGRLLLTVLHG